MARRGSSSRALEDALFSIMKSTPFASISVSELAGVAGVDRSTFYRSVGTKERAVKRRIRRLMDGSAAVFAQGEQRSFEAYLQQVFCAMIEQREMFELLFRDGLEHVVREAFEEMFVDETRTFDISARTRYLLAYHAGGITSFLERWVARGGIDDVSDLVAYASSMFPDTMTPVRLQLMGGTR